MGTEILQGPVWEHKADRRRSAIVVRASRPQGADLCRLSAFVCISVGATPTRFFHRSTRAEARQPLASSTARHRRPARRVLVFQSGSGSSVLMAIGNTLYVKCDGIYAHLRYLRFPMRWNPCSSVPKSKPNPTSKQSTLYEVELPPWTRDHPQE